MLKIFFLKKTFLADDYKIKLKILNDIGIRGIILTVGKRGVS
jgi:hypothetical protein